MNRITLSMTLVFLMGGSLKHTHAATPTEVAQQFVNLGQTLFKEGNYSAALEHFHKAAERLDGLEGGVPPVLYRNIARCHDQLGNVKLAIDNYQRFVDKAPDSPKLAKAVRHAREAVTRLQRILDATALSFSIKPKGAVVVFDGKRLAKIPTGNWRVSPGKHSVKVSAAGYQPRTMDVSVTVGSTVPLIIQLEKEGGAVPAAPVSRGASKMLPLILSGVAVVSLGGAVWAKVESDAIYNSPENLSGPTVNSRTADSEVVGNLGWGLAVLGGAALVGAIISWPTDEAKAALVPTAGADGGGLVWRGRF